MRLKRSARALRDGSDLACHLLLHAKKEANPLHAQGGLCGGSDLACHIDGFIATAAHTLLVQPDAAAPVEGRSAEILAARADRAGRRAAPRAAWEEHRRGVQPV